MLNKEKIDHLLLDIRELEKLIAGMRDAEIYPASFFRQTYESAHKIISRLNGIESSQLEILRLQMEEHKRFINTIPQPKPEELPEMPEGDAEPADSDPLPETAAIDNNPVPHKETDIVAEKKNTIFLSEILEKKQLSDFRKAISLNDHFRFRRELFGGDEKEMSKAIADLNELNTLEDSMSYLNGVLKWNMEDEAVAGFIQLLEKRFL